MLRPATITALCALGGALLACGPAPSPAPAEAPSAPQTSPAPEAAPVATAAPAPATDAGVLNLYSARHYDADDAIYASFEAETGIRIRRIEANGEMLLERLKAEGAQSPADVVITVDAGRLWATEAAGLFQAHGLAAAAAVPARLQDPNGTWVAVAKRLRVIVHAPERIAAEAVDTYEELADPALKGRLCVRSSGNVYNLSLLAGLIERWGPERAEAWATGVAQNLARPPEGGDTDQIRAVAAGVCDAALVNHYYWVRLSRSADAADQAVVAATRVIWPDQAGDGVHANISGAGVAAHAPNPENARRFLAYLLSEPVQTRLAQSNDEYPATGAPLENPELAALGTPKEDDGNVRIYGERQAEAAAIFDRAGWP